MKIYILIIIFSAILDIFANLALKKSECFKRKFWGFGAIFLAIVAFISLSFVIDFVPLSVAYSTWGAFGIIGTTLGGYIFYKEKLNLLGYIGICFIILAVILLNL